MRKKPPQKETPSMHPPRKKSAQLPLKMFFEITGAYQTAVLQNINMFLISSGNVFI
jgi:hypothetical protein